MKNKDSFPIVSKEYIGDKTYVIRGQKVMLDTVLAKIYGYTTKCFNEQAVKPNLYNSEKMRFYRFDKSTEYIKNISKKIKNMVKSRYGNYGYI